MQRPRSTLFATAAAVALAALAPAPALAAPAGKPRTVKLWFMTGEQFRTVTRDVKASDSTTKSAVAALLKGPRKAERDDDYDTQIPKGVSLKERTVGKDGTATVRMSPGFLKDVPADPAARTADQQIKLKARLGQLTYTVTQFKHIKQAVVFAGTTSLADSDRGDYAKPSTGPAPIVVDPGAAVAGTTEIQQSLARMKYLPDDAVDGKLGYRTTQAIIAFQSWEGLGRDGVVGPATSAKLKTASTPKPKGSGRRIEVYREKGVTLLVSGGKTLRAIHTSSGAPGYATPTGTYNVFRKELKSWSVPYSVWLPYASYFNNGIAFHAWADIPTYPASHGCVRVAAPEAPRVYEFASNGTTVNVY
jgi:lipoprotein-anchoring transpeptidase ErfK/SrfK